MVWRRQLGRFGAVKQFHLAELLVGNAQNADAALIGQNLFHPADMHIRILAAHAMPDVQAELEHGETIVQDLLPEFRIALAVGRRFGGQVEHYKYPHNPVGV